MNGKNIIIIFILLFVLSSSHAFAATTTIFPIMDNTLAEELPDNSSGECESIFAGNTDASFARRALLQFDIAGSILPGSIINNVTLTMTITRGGNNADSTMSLHRVSTAWVEGVEGCGVRGGGQGDPSTGGSTWNTPWATPGGDFNATATASAPVVGANQPVWDSTDPGNAAMVSDVQGWLDGTVPNNGWILIGDEINPTTARRFGSSENAAAPVLTVDYTPVGDTFACCLAAPAGDCQEFLVGDEASCTGAGGTVFPDPACNPNPCPQPVGACCNADESCSEISRDVCIAGGGLFQGANSLCSDTQVDCGLTPFIEPLPIPPVLQPTGTRTDGVLQYTVSVEQAIQNVHSKLPDTTVWTYNGAWPAATIVASKDTPIEVTYINNLPSGGGGRRGTNLLEVDTCAHGPNSWADSKRVVTHLHGGHVPARVDGQPEYHIMPGETDIYEYPNNQDAATLWYHDHALGITRLNVYGGMAGFYLLADSEDTLGPGNAFGLPSGQYEIGLAIQDRTFNPDGSLFYNAQLEDAFKGDKIVVNGKVWPFLNVDQGKYRFRILNGSQAREYSLRLENISAPGNDPSFILVGTDVGLASAPIDLGNTISQFVPGDRMDVVIDFASYLAGTEIVLRNDEQTPPLLPNIMKFVVTGNPGYTGAISSTLRPVTPMPEGSQDVTRYFRLDMHPNSLCKDASGRLVNEWVVQSLDGPGGNVIGEFWDDLTEFPVLGTREVWEFENPTSAMHPMHVHLVKFQILSKTALATGQPIPLEPWEINTWKDIVRVPPNSSARIIMDFTDYLGRFPQHCHILDHEDHEMMRQFQTTNDPANAVIDGVCSASEDCVSNPADCPKVSGALCGNGLCEAGDGENCITCPADCAGKQSGAASKQFCCGDEFAGNPTNPIDCGVDANDNRCISSGDNLYCRVATRLEACCGDRLCEGQETEGNCPVDCAPPPPCTPTEPTDVTCDGIDGDCDGQVDEDYIITATSCGQGVCASTGQLECQAGTEVDTCTPGPQNEPADTTCDGLDGDCDGQVDEDYIITSTSCGVGACLGNAGQMECQSGSEVDTCDPFAGATGEICDALDNDCDGTIDNGFDVDVDTYTTCGADGIPGNSDDDCDDLDLNIYPGGPAIRKVGTPNTYYTVFQDAYDNTTPSGTLQIQDHEFTEVLLLDDATTVIFQVGYDCGYSNNTGVSIVTGGMTIDNGAVTLDSGTLEIR